MAKNKTRLDVALVEKGLAESREKAKPINMSGIEYDFSYTHLTQPTNTTV